MLSNPLLPNPLLSLESSIEDVIFFPTEKLKIEYDNSKVNFDDIKQVVEKAGYGIIKEESNKKIDMK
ncbi:hypothetical protein ACTPD5_20845, partial [Clostridioides difficile]|uniref:hypothetical protein n=1 Tax=Clostridioides difficile TaxID=1496 RepID=UPI003F8CFD4D